MIEEKRMMNLFKKAIFDLVEKLDLDKESKKLFIKKWLDNINEVLNE